MLTPDQQAAKEVEEIYAGYTVGERSGHFDETRKNQMTCFNGPMFVVPVEYMRIGIFTDILNEGAHEEINHSRKRFFNWYFNHKHDSYYTGTNNVV